MTIVPATADAIINRTAIPLAYYARTVGYPEAAFFGFYREDDLRHACRNVWSKWERDTVVMYLTQAQELMEAQLHYPLTETWFEGELHTPTVPMYLKWKYLRALGVRTETSLGTVAVDFGTEPATLTIATTEDPASLHLMNGEAEVTPSSVEVVGGDVVFRFPRARIAKEEENPLGGWDWNDTSGAGPFLQELEVVKVETAGSIGTWQKLNCSTCGWEDMPFDCSQIITPRDSAILVRRDWCRTWQVGKVNINYAAWKEDSQGLWDATIRLAHALMPKSPCGCDLSRQNWERDRKVPDAVTAERVNCPFGMSDGAWFAWVTANHSRILTASLL